MLAQNELVLIDGRIKRETYRVLRMICGSETRRAWQVRPT
jgi:hypothetical protein